MLATAFSHSIQGNFVPPHYPAYNLSLFLNSLKLPQLIRIDRLSPSGVEFLDLNLRHKSENCHVGGRGQITSGLVEG